ncbi:hypothetical protein MJM95_30705, partial [Salmonella enterica subsp. enterica serovar Anatum]|nr:hypothetical protein [Salmonella enterica subsp. enterica serovar Anatum]
IDLNDPQVIAARFRYLLRQGDSDGAQKLLDRLAQLAPESTAYFQVTVPADVNGVRLSIDGGKTWFDATQSATSGVWDYTWLTNV